MAYVTAVTGPRTPRPTARTRNVPVAPTRDSRSPPNGTPSGTATAGSSAAPACRWSDGTVDEVDVLRGGRVHHLAPVAAGTAGIPSRWGYTGPALTVGGHAPSSRISASPSPGQGGIVTPMATRGSSEVHRNWKAVPTGIV